MDMEGKEYTAILAVGDDGKAIVFKWLNKEDWMEEAIRQFNDLDEIDFNTIAGLYYADMTYSACGGDKCLGYPCAGDCWQSDWELKCLVDLKYLTMNLLTRLYTEHQFAENETLRDAIMNEIENIERLERDIIPSNDHSHPLGNQTQAESSALPE